METKHQVFDYLIANSFLKDFTGCQALAAAFDLGLINLLEREEQCTLAQVCEALSIDHRGLKLLTDILQSTKVLFFNNNPVYFSEDFKIALKYKDFLFAQIDFANLVAPDLVKFFPLLVKNIDEFMRRASLFKLFDYSKAMELNEDNYVFTERWMNFTTALTRYEGEVCTAFHDFSVYKSMMDVGGNSGEFALKICQHYSQLQATVVDLPVVCAVGRNHVSAYPHGDRIEFFEANALKDDLPKEVDIITFKSILHDWPEEAVIQFISNASTSLCSGGTLLIFERAPLDFGASSIPYYMIPMMLFFRSFRSPELYQQQLNTLGFKNIRVQHFTLECPFFIVTAEKP